MLSADLNHDGTIVVPGTFPIDLCPELGADLPTGDHATVVGLILDRLGRIPDRPGDSVVVEGWSLEVIEVSGKAITRVLLRPRPEAAGSNGVGIDRTDGGVLADVSAGN